MTEPSTFEHESPLTSCRTERSPGIRLLTIVLLMQTAAKGFGSRVAGTWVPNQRRGCPATDVGGSRDPRCRVAAINTHDDDGLMLSTTVLAATGLLAGWSVPKIAHLLPSRNALDRSRLEVWPLRVRIAAAIVSGAAFTSAALFFSSGDLRMLSCLLAPVLLTSAVVDLRTARLPDRLTFAGAAIVVAGALWLTVGGDGSATLRASMGAGAFAGILGAVHLIRPDGMGRGDVKLVGLLGGYLGLVVPTTSATVRLVVIALVAAIVGTLLISVVVGTIRRSIMAAVPFGPGLVGATWIAALGAQVG
jgi:leader peptidase (prepilin peptidase) / N-methyltransferase